MGSETRQAMRAFGALVGVVDVACNDRFGDLEGKTATGDWLMGEREVGVEFEVYCDLCNQKHTEKDSQPGGIVFNKNAICPTCSPQIEAEAKRRGEEGLIEERAKADEMFHAFVVRVRNAMLKDHDMAAWLPYGARCMAEAFDQFFELGGACMIMEHNDGRIAVGSSDPEREVLLRAFTNEMRNRTQQHPCRVLDAAINLAKQLLPNVVFTMTMRTPTGDYHTHSDEDRDIGELFTELARQEFEENRHHHGLTKH